MAEIKKFLDLTALGALVDQIKAEDVKGLDAAKSYADGLAGNYDAAGSAATAKSEAIAAAEEKVQALADGAVKTNTEAIATLNGADTVEGSVAKAVKDAKDALQGNIDGVEDKADANAEAILAINNETTGILAQAKADAKSKADAVQGNVDALAEKVGTVPEGSTVMGIIANIQENAYDDTALKEEINGKLDLKADKTQVATDIADAVKVEKEAREAAVSGVQGAVDALSGTHATDKKALEDAIALKADITALDAVSVVANAAVKQSDYDVKVAALEAEDARIAGLVTAEQTRAEGVEAGLEERLVEVEAFFKLAEGEQLDEALDTLKELQDFVNGEGAAADQMVLDIAANKKAIEDHVATDHDFGKADAELQATLEAEIAKKADKTTVEGIDGRLTTAEGKITTVEGKVSTLEGKMTAVEGAVATKAEAQDLTDAVAALEGVDAGQETRIAALEAKFGEGEGNVEDMIADAKQEAIDAASADATSKANTAEANAIAKANELNTAMNTRVEALEAIDHEHANKELLDTYTQTEADLADAVDKKHAHANATVLDGISAEKVAAWDAAEANAKSHADGLNTAMTSKVDGVDARVKTLEETIVDKAEKDDLDAAVERIAKNETAIAANTSAINSFSAITADEVNALFA